MGKWDNPHYRRAMERQGRSGQRDLGRLAKDPRAFGEAFKAFAEGTKGDDSHLKGRRSAAPILQRNRVDDEATAAVVLQNSFDFRNFQDLSLYHQNGYFARRVDYKKTMSLLPQQLSPLFGKMMAEVAFAMYANHPASNAQPPTLLSLGAGRGYLDHDLIRHIASKMVEDPGFPQHIKAYKEKSRFLITDAGEYALSRMQQELRPILSDPQLAARVHLSRLDATEFQLEKEPFGIVYANELVDNLLTEPVVKINGKLYAVKMLPHDPTSKGENALSVNNIRGVVSRESARARIDADELARLRFDPVFVPLESDDYLWQEARKTEGLRKIDRQDFGGIYPLHVRLEGLYESVRRSFDHGIVILVDYVSREEGMHNWNVAVNQYGERHVFGSADIDFQIDPEQVIERAARHGMRCVYSAPLSDPLRQATELLLDDYHGNMKRWSEAMGLKAEGKKLSDAFTMNYAHMIGAAGPAYRMIILEF